MTDTESRSGDSIREHVDTLLRSNRILILGPSGGGKTYLARRLGAILSREPTHLDALFWRPGWTSMPQSEWRHVMESLVAPEQWIMDGTYESTLDLRIPAADAIVIVQRSRWACLWGVLRRKWMYRSRPRPDAPARQPIDAPFLRYIWHYQTRTRPVVESMLVQFGADKIVVRLDGRSALEELLSDLDAREGEVRRALNPQRPTGSQKIL